MERNYCITFLIQDLLRNLTNVPLEDGNKELSQEIKTSFNEKRTLTRHLCLNCCDGV